MEQYEFHDPLSNERKWVVVEPKITELTLNQDSKTGRRTLLQKHEPGSATTGDFVHDYVEEIYIVDGALTDTKLGKTFEKGYYAYRKPGMVHGPYISKDGCLMFITATPV
jgi:hypothetical protein